MCVCIRRIEEESAGKKHRRGEIWMFEVRSWWCRRKLAKREMGFCREDLSVQPLTPCIYSQTKKTMDKLLELGGAVHTHTYIYIYNMNGNKIRHIFVIYDYEYIFYYYL